MSIPPDGKQGDNLITQFPPPPAPANPALKSYQNSLGSIQVHSPVNSHVSVLKPGERTGPFSSSCVSPPPPPLILCFYEMTSFQQTPSPFMCSMIFNWSTTINSLYVSFPCLRPKLRDLEGPPRTPPLLRYCPPLTSTSPSQE